MERRMSFDLKYFLIFDMICCISYAFEIISNSQKAEFWIDGDENSCNAGELISTQSLVFKNGHVIDSFCSTMGW